MVNFKFRKEQFLNHVIETVILLTIFLFFFSTAIGLIDIQFYSGLKVHFRHVFMPSNPVQASDILLVAIRSTEAIGLFVTGILLCIFLPVLNPVMASIVTALSVIPPFVINYLNPGQSSSLPMEYSLLTILMIYAINVLISYFIETHSRQKLVTIFSQYIPPELVAEISRHPEKINLEGEAKVLTVFFCDLQNFSSVAEQLNPKQLAHLLNEYFTAMTKVLYEHGATIDKYIGDSIMAFWNAPLSQDDHARRAILSSFRMHEEIKRLSVEFLKRGWPGPNMGIGINTGTMNVGNMGSIYRIAYTVVGDSVNLAARLETLTRKYQVPTIVSETTRGEVNDIVFRELDLVQVKGKHNKTKIYQPVCEEKFLDDSTGQKLELHQTAIDYYFEEDWENAYNAFKLLEANYSDDKYYSYILNQISRLNKMENQPVK